MVGQYNNTRELQNAPLETRAPAGSSFQGVCDPAARVLESWGVRTMDLAKEPEINAAGATVCTFNNKGGGTIEVAETLDANGGLAQTSVTWNNYNKKGSNLSATLNLDETGKPQDLTTKISQPGDPSADQTAAFDFATKENQVSGTNVAFAHNKAHAAIKGLMMDGPQNNLENNAQAAFSNNLRNDLNNRYNAPSFS